MAATVDAANISSAMQTSYASLATRGAAGTDVTIKEMCDVVANAVAAEVNATIVATYSAHNHTTTATIGAGATVGVISTPVSP